MYNDIYLRSEDDPNFVPDTLTTSDELENLVTQTRMTLLTNVGEVLGFPYFGFSAMDYLFELNYINLNSLATGAKDQIDTYCTLAENHKVETSAQVYKLEKYRDAVGLNIDIDNLGGFGVLLD
jgi:hypothetical protein